MMNCSLFFPLLLVFLFACGPSGGETDGAETQDAVSTFILVRHAEKGDGDDPDLTPEGAARAERLRDRLAQEHVTKIYSTDTRRTRQTAAPTAEEAGLEVMVYSPDDLDGFARSLKQQSSGETVLIVGHSNTTPALANLLSETGQLTAFDDSDYGNLLIVSVPQTGKARVENLRY